MEICCLGLDTHHSLWYNTHMTNNPYNELPHPVFLRYVAQNDYMIDGYYLPEGVRLNAAADELESLQIRYDELWKAHQRLAQTCKEAEERVDTLLERVKERVRP